MGAEFAEAWLLAALLIGGLSAGALGLLLLGRLLGREWVTPLDDELVPAAWTLPLAGVLAVPVIFLLPQLFAWASPGWIGPSAAITSWFAPGAFVVRTALFFALWTALAFRFSKPPKSRGWNALGLALLLPTLTLMGVDWVLGREPLWWSSLFGFGFAVSQLAPALALALLANALQQEHVSHLHDRSLTSALLTLSLAILWIWFVQFLAAWLGNLPHAAAWYQARLVGGRWISIALAAAMLAVAILLLIQRNRGRFSLHGAAALIVGQHVLHSFWLLRPADTPGANWIDILVLLLVGGGWIFAWAILMRRRDGSQSGRLGSSNRGRSGGTSGGQTMGSPEPRL